MAKSNKEQPKVDLEDIILEKEPEEQVKETKQPKVDLESLISQSGLTEAQLRSLLEDRDTERVINEKVRVRKRVEIKDFNDKRVKPFGEETIYSIYSSKSNAQIKASGKTLEWMFTTGDKQTKKDFAQKKLGGTLANIGKGGRYRVKFLFAISEE